MIAGVAGSLAVKRDGENRGVVAQVPFRVARMSVADAHNGKAGCIATAGALLLLLLFLLLLLLNGTRGEDCVVKDGGRWGGGVAGESGRNNG